MGLPLLALYIHWPFCAKKCPYCDYNSYAIGWHPEEAALWGKAYIRALETLVCDYPQHRLDTVFLGGGTPSQMPLSVLESLLSAIQDLFPVRADAVEITLEANPRDISKALLQSYYNLGVNRISLGVQSLDDDELMFLGRDHNAKVAREALDAVATVFDRYSIDLMYGLPHHTVALWQGRLEEALSLGTRHLSLYQLTIEPETGFYRPFQRGDYKLPENSALADLFNLTHDVCAGRGLVGYEISSFAQLGQECRHNLHYWYYNSYFGIGPGSHGRVHHNGTTFAIASFKNPLIWREGILNQAAGIVEKTPLTPSEAALERLYMGLRLKGGIQRPHFQDLQNGGFVDREAYHRLRAQGLMDEDEKTVFLTDKGRLRLDGVVVDVFQG